MTELSSHSSSDKMTKQKVQFEYKIQPID